MNINIIYPYKNALKYINQIESSEDPNYEELWDKYLVQPYWDKISEWAPGAFGFMKPKPIKNIVSLKEQLQILDKIDFQSMENDFIRIIRALPKNDDDEITVAIYPLDNENTVVREKQNGVIGCCVAGNIVISVNPLAKDYQDWISYVFAHEYHHSVWGHHWYVVKGGLKGTLIEYLLNEGQADAFAKSLHPHLRPSWLSNISKEEENNTWSKIQSVLNSTDRDIHAKYMFGSKELNIPWCIGYYFGNAIIDSYLENNSEVGFKELVDIYPEEILKMSGFEIQY